MSLEGYVFSNRVLTSIAEWQQAIDALGFPLTLASDRDLRAQTGHLPAWLDGREAGFECSWIDVEEVRQTYDEIDLGGPWTTGMVFYFGSLPGCVAGWMAIAAWASATDGVTFDPQDGTLSDAQATVRSAREALEQLPGVERKLRESGLLPGT